MVNPRAALAVLAILALPLCLPGAARAAGDCDRAAFGGWRQEGRIDTRHRVLIRDSISPVDLSGDPGERLRVVDGAWVSAFTGRTVAGDPYRRVEIDHLIPVCWAWAHGAAGWSRDRRRAFYNDETLLVVVEPGQNRAKGARGVMDFVPPGDGACAYVTRVADGLARHGLTVPPDDLDALRRTVALCGRGNG